MELRVGCAMWANKSWFGESLPLANTAGSELAAYASLLTAVEGNTTFYALPTTDTARRWAEAVPESFRFMFKLPREVTHDRKLRNADACVASFLRIMEPCHALMDPVAIQLPPSFGPESLSVLEAFLNVVPSSLRWAVEVRHPSFFELGDEERRLNDMLFTTGADRIILDSRAVFAGPCASPEEREAFSNKPRIPARAVATNDRPVVRFIGQTAADANPPYLAPWVDTAIRWLRDGRTPTVFIHTPDNAVAPDLCRLFHAKVREQIPELKQLPERTTLPTPRLFE